MFYFSTWARLRLSPPQTSSAGGHSCNVVEYLPCDLVNVLVVEPRYADPLSLVFYKKVLVTKGALEQFKEMFA